MLSWIKPSAISFWRWLAVAAIVAGIGIGFAIGFVTRQSTVDDLNSIVAEREAELAQAQGQLSEVKSQVEGLGASVAQLRQQAAGLQGQLDEKVNEISTLRGANELVAGLEQRIEGLNRQLETVSTSDPAALELIREVAAAFEVDRMILADLRKNPPDVRDDARKFWSDLKGLAVKSDSSLASKADKVTAALPAYFNWFERDFASAEESTLTYLLTGAAGYDSSINEFWEAFFLVVIDRIDILAELTS